MSRLSDIVRAARPRPPALPAWLERMASLGIVSADQKIVRRQRFTNIFALASAANVATHVAAFGIYDPFGLSWLIGFDLLFFAALAAVPLLHRYGVELAAHVLSGLSIVAILLTLLMLGRDSQIYVYFALSGILLFMFGVENRRSWVPWFGVALTGLTLSVPLVSDTGLLSTGDEALRRIVSSHAMVNVAVVNALVIFFALSSLRRTELALEDAHSRTSALVSTLLPPSVAARLTAAPDRRIADRIDGLSVLFADLAGFTAAARPLPPDEIVDWLDTIVRGFDDLCVAAGAQKIKTIGDSYMAVGGLDGDAGRGALAIGRLALAMLEAPDLRRPLGASVLSLRIGIHAGSATAGIIGDTRFSYDVWGDAVNVASRMESHGLPGRIHVSDEFHRIAAGDFAFEERGEIEVKGLGKQRTHFLTGVRAGS